MENFDSRLIEAYKLIEAEKIRVLSLDIFDTLLWRKIPEASDLFLLLGKQLKEEKWLISGLSEENFSLLRIEAEKLARKEKESTHECSEITLHEIYWKLHHLFKKISLEQMLREDVKGIYEKEVDELVRKEVDLEKQFLLCDPNIAHLLFYAHQRQISTILVSDTYFEQGHIRHFLKGPFPFLQKSILESLGSLYLSSEYGCGKQSGLFQRIIEEREIDPQKMLHIGDNFKSDIFSASQVGIRTVHFCKYDKKMQELLDAEWPKDPYKRKEFLSESQGDFGITALRAKVEHHVLLSSIRSRDCFFWKYGATVLGPVLMGFVHWIYKRCQEKKQNHVFCLMREGKLYAQLIELFAPYYPEHNLKATPLWVSRTFITHASIMQANRKELHASMKSFFEHYTINACCNYLGIDVRKMDKWKRYENVVLEDSNVREEFITYLITNESIRSQIILAAKSKRERFFTYISNLINRKEISLLTLVDVGWNGTIQSSLRRVFDMQNFDMPIDGLYLGTTRKAQLGLLEGINCEGYLFNGGHPFDNAYMKGCFVLEQTATAETGLGPLEDIDETGHIITNPSFVPLKQKKEASLIQQGIFTFFNIAGPYFKSNAIEWDAHCEKLKNQLRAILLRSMTQATNLEARRLGSWLHEHGPSIHLTQTIGKHPYYEKYIKDMLPMAAFKESGLNWPAAYAARHSKYLALMSQAVWLKIVPPECLLSEDNFSLKVFVDKGKGFSKKANKNVCLRSNPNRNFYASTKIFSSKKNIRHILLVLSFPSSIVRIKSLRMDLYDKEVPYSEQIIFFESEGTSFDIECIAHKRINFNTFYCKDDLRFICQFTDRKIYQLKVKLCCEMFPNPMYSESLIN